MLIESLECQNFAALLIMLEFPTVVILSYNSTKFPILSKLLNISTKLFLPYTKYCKS